MDKKYLNRIIEISTHDNSRAQRILHIMGDNEWLKMEFIGSILITIFLFTLIFSLINSWLFLLPLSILLILSRRITLCSFLYLNYRKYLIRNNIINKFGICKKPKF